MNVLTSSRQIDVQDLLQPIPGANPAGESLRYQGTYDRIADARREDDPSLSQGIYKSTLKRADWTTAEAICVEALTKRSKDLQIAGWLLEAWLHLHGFAGVTNGLRLLAGLCEQFWDHLYPTLEAGDLEGRIAPFDWIEQKLTLKLKQIPLTLPSDTINETYSYVDWESACHFENLAMKDPRALQEALAKINPTVATFRAAITGTDLSFHLEMVQDLNNAIECMSCGRAGVGTEVRQGSAAVAPVQRSAQFDSTTRLPGLAGTRSASRSIQRRRIRSPRSRRTRRRIMVQRTDSQSRRRVSQIVGSRGLPASH